MSLEKSRARLNLKKHSTSKKEIESLFRIIERDLKDAEVKSVSSDRRFSTAYNAALQIATVVIHCEGYRTEGHGHHAVTFKALREVSGFKELSGYFERCRKKRNQTDYIAAGIISEKEAEELTTKAKDFFKDLKKWLKKNHPKLYP